MQEVPYRLLLWGGLFCTVKGSLRHDGGNVSLTALQRTRHVQNIILARMHNTVHARSQLDTFVLQVGRLMLHGCSPVAGGGGEWACAWRQRWGQMGQQTGSRHLSALCAHLVSCPARPEAAWIICRKLR